MDPALSQALSDLLHGGTRPVLESGAGFVSPTEFAAHQKLLRDYFDLRVETPRDLWRRKSEGTTLLAHRPVRRKRLDRHEPVPYVSYDWPREA